MACAQEVMAGGAGRAACGAADAAAGSAAAAFAVFSNSPNLPEAGLLFALLAEAGACDGFAAACSVLCVLVLTCMAALLGCPWRKIVASADVLKGRSTDG